MDDLKFENQILQAEVAALRGELSEVKEKYGFEAKKIAAAQLRLNELETLKQDYADVGEENMILNTRLAQLEKVHIEIESWKGLASRLKRQVEDLSESGSRRTITFLKEMIKDRDEVIETNKWRLYRKTQDVEKLEAEVKFLEYQMTWPAIRKRNRKWKLISLVLAFCLAVISIAHLTFILPI